ncbi:ATP-binding protein [Apilactobacillus kunkeei]|uniref:ATP-binding protein n=1 Tax=Apilactobacillus kunkeei TaxID=148814 RepID=UPI00110CD446|nr:ATP-binding protein [Apilactobacillus kunkeei]TMS99121.1 ATP-binding protein [Apilactobacillus kunkeei]
MALGFIKTMQAVDLIEKSGAVANIVGLAGIGKSALVNRLAEQNCAKLFTTVVSLSEKGDLAIPVPPLTNKSFIETDKYGTLADVKFGYSHTIIEIIKYAEANPDKPIYWFLDEFNRGTSDVQSELMNLVLQRRINSVVLPKQVHIIIAENPDDMNANYDVYASDDAITDRTVRVNMRTDVNDWLDWAKDNQINQQVINFINENNLLLDQGNDEIKPTPRSWQRVSNIVNQYNDDYDEDILKEVISGNVGPSIAESFIKFMHKSGDDKINLNDNLQDVVDKLASKDEVAKQSLVSEYVKSVSTLSDDICYRFKTFIDLLSSDGQYAIARILINDTGLIDDIYNKSETSLAAKQLYDELTQISFNAYR